MTTEGIDAPVLIEREEQLLRVRINRPQVANALDRASRTQILDAFREAERDRDIRAVLLSAEGRHFCVGADLRAFTDEQAGDGARTGDVATRIAGVSTLVSAVRDCPKPVVGAVHGAISGMGLGLALACDVLVADDTAWFGGFFVDRGLLPDGLSIYLLVRSVGIHRTKQLLLLGRRIDVEEAAASGLVADVVAPEELDRRAEAMAMQLARGATFTLGAAKRLVNQAFDNDIQTAALLESLTQEAIAASHDVAEGVASYLEGRPTEFHGY